MKAASSVTVVSKYTLSVGDRNTVPLPFCVVCVAAVPLKVAFCVVCVVTVLVVSPGCFGTLIVPVVIGGPLGTLAGVGVSEDTEHTANTITSIATHTI